MPGPVWGAGAGRLADGRVLLYGGSLDINAPGSSPSSAGALFDPATDTWKATASGPDGRVNAGIYPGPDGTELVMGTTLSGVLIRIVPLIYDPMKDRWHSGQGQAPGGDAFFASYAQLLDGRVLAVSSASAAIYNPKADAWTKVPTAPTARNNMTLVTLTDGRVLAIAGEESANRPSPAARLFDPKTATWSLAAQMPITWRLPKLIAMPDGSAVALGGPGFGFGVNGAVRYDPTTNSWGSVLRLLVARQEPTIAGLADGRVLVMGGSVSAPDCAVVTGGEILDPTAGTWSAVAGLSEARDAAVGTVLQDGRVLIALGAMSASVAVNRNTCELNRFVFDSEVLDPTLLAPVTLPAATAPTSAAVGLGTFSASKAAASNRATAVTLADGSALLLGGYTVAPPNLGGFPVATSAVWHVSGDGTLHKAAPMTSTRVSPYAVRLSDGTVLVIGPDVGAFVSGKPRGPAAERYDPVTDRWHKVADPGDRTGAALAALPDGRAILIGGVQQKFGAPYAIDAGTLLFDPTTETWSKGPKLPIARLDPAVVSLSSGQVLVAGGIGEDGAVASAFTFDPSTNAWSPVADLPAARARAHGLLLTDGRVMLVGGYGTDSQLPDAVIFDPIAGTWTTTPSFGQAREHAALALTADGRVLLAGGFISDGTMTIVATTLVFDPQSSTWSNGPAMKTARADAVALLVGGSVQIIGGRPDGLNPQPLASRETLGSAGP